jgi:hypothetical protein
MLLKQIDVWEYVNKNSAVCYHCFEVLGKNKFYVQSKDTLYLNANSFFSGQKTDSNFSEQKKSFDKQFLELLCDNPPKHLTKYSSLSAAIDAFEK